MDHNTGQHAFPKIHQKTLSCLRYFCLLWIAGIGHQTHLSDFASFSARTKIKPRAETQSKDDCYL